MIKKRFYCPACKKFLDRRQVIASEEYTMETVYFCRWCDNSVMKVSKLLKAIIMDFAEYVVSKGKEEDFE